MKELSAIEEQIHNQGERLIPGVTDDTVELVRHKSSYELFRRVIESDLISGHFNAKGNIRILDLGCGVGHGAYMLADIPGTTVIAIDCSEDTINYAKTHYDKVNITYVVIDAARFVETMPEFDYVVSRHALEHIPNGIAVAAACKYSARLMVNVPFDEADVNPHHRVHFIREASFVEYEDPEILYEDLTGVTYYERPENLTSNSIICISSKSPFPKIKKIISFPVPAWRPEFLQGRWLKVFDEIGDPESHIEALQSQLDEAHQIASRLQRELEKTRRTVSWRVTAPLRAGRKTLDSLLGRFRNPPPISMSPQPGSVGITPMAEDRDHLGRSNDRFA